MLKLQREMQNFYREQQKETELLSRSTQKLYKEFVKNIDETVLLQICSTDGKEREKHRGILEDELAKHTELLTLCIQSVVLRKSIDLERNTADLEDQLEHMYMLYSEAEHALLNVLWKKLKQQKTVKLQEFLTVWETSIENYKLEAGVELVKIQDSTFERMVLKSQSYPCLRSEREVELLEETYKNLEQLLSIVDPWEKEKLFETYIQTLCVMQNFKKSRKMRDFAVYEIMLLVADVLKNEKLFMNPEVSVGEAVYSMFVEEVEIAYVEHIQSFVPNTKLSQACLKTAYCKAIFEAYRTSPVGEVRQKLLGSYTQEFYNLLYSPKNDLDYDAQTFSLKPVKQVETEEAYLKRQFYEIYEEEI